MCNNSEIIIIYGHRHHSSAHTVAYIQSRLRVARAPCKPNFSANIPFKKNIFSREI